MSSVEYLAYMERFCDYFSGSLIKVLTFISDNPLCLCLSSLALFFLCANVIFCFVGKS